MNSKKIDRNSSQRSPTYAAMVHSLDDAIGKLIDAVDHAGIADRTAFVFISDNGGNMYNSVDGTTPTSNAPLRGGKATIYEGGIRVPCVISWPGITKSKTESSEIIQTSDLYPTILNRLGIEIPNDHKVDGVDLLPAMQGHGLKREATFTYFPHSPPVPDWLPPSVCVHQKDWKLIRLFHQGEAGSHRHLLFNLKDDIGEQNDLSQKYPDRVVELDRLIERHLTETNAVAPIPNPKFDSTKYKPQSEGVGKMRTPKKTKPNPKTGRKQKLQRNSKTDVCVTNSCLEI